MTTIVHGARVSAGRLIRVLTPLLALVVTLGLAPEAAASSTGTDEDAAVVQRWIPRPDTVSISVETRDRQTYATVTVQAPSSNHVIRHWGLPGLRVNAHPIVLEGPGLTVITPREHTYRLGTLRPGDYTFVFACWGEPVQRKEFTVPPPDDPAPPPERWIPRPDTVSISVETRDHQTYATVTVQAPSSNHVIRHWGLPGLRVNARPIVLEGPGLDVITPREHTYRLGMLRPGDYTFVFACWGEPVQRKEFTVPPPDDPAPPPERWIPEPDTVSISVETRDRQTYATVTVQAPSSNHVIRHWGPPGLRVNARPIVLEGPGLTVITPREHTYRLGTLRPGDYTFVFACWGEPVQSKEFTVPPPDDPAPPPERWIPEPDTVSILVETRDRQTYATVTVQAPSSNHVIRHWGLPGLRVNARPIVLEGPGLPVVTPREHTYRLGTLRPGDYTFVFACWGEPVQSKEFTVPPPDDPAPPPERWIPEPDTVSISVETRDRQTYATVTVQAPSSNHVIRHWGLPGLRVNARPVIDGGIGLPVVTSIKHTYHLPHLPPGEYTFEFACWGEPVQRHDFTVTRPEGRMAGDLTRDGRTGFLDFIFLLENWGEEIEGEPLGFADFLAILTYWGEAN